MLKSFMQPPEAAPVDQDVYGTEDGSDFEFESIEGDEESPHGAPCCPAIGVRAGMAFARAGGGWGGGFHM
jgi:hypothetical protein